MYLPFFKQYQSVVTDIGMAQQFLAGFSTEEVYLRRPTHDGVTCDELLAYMLKEEARNTAKLGAYSGTVESILDLDKVH